MEQVLEAIAEIIIRLAVHAWNHGSPAIFRVVTLSIQLLVHTLKQVTWGIFRIIPSLLNVWIVIPPGKVGVQVWPIGGAVQSEALMPGMNWLTPGSEVHFVNTQLGTVAAEHVYCGTVGGTDVRFRRVEVLWRLQSIDFASTLVASFGPNFDTVWLHSRIHHEIAQLCSTFSIHDALTSGWGSLAEPLAAAIRNATALGAPGIDIISARLGSVHMPHTLSTAFDEAGALRAALQVQVRTAASARAEAESNHTKAISLAESALHVANISANRAIAAAESLLQAEAIDLVTMIAQAKANADAHAQHIRALANAEKHVLTPEYLAYLRAEAELSSVPWNIMGDAVPEGWV